MMYEDELSEHLEKYKGLVTSNEHARKRIGMLVDWAAKGYTYEEIGRKHGISRGRVHQMVRKARIELRAGKHTHVLREHLHLLANDGKGSTL